MNGRVAAGAPAARGPPALLALTSAALLAGALGFQYLGGLSPCEMCLWQRWAHGAVLLFAGLAMVRPSLRTYGLAVAAMAVAAALGLYHAGVEQHWWQGATACTAATPVGVAAADAVAILLDRPLARCDEVPWAFLGLSMAGWNALISAAAAVMAAVWAAHGTAGR